MESPERLRLLILVTLADVGGAQAYVAALLPALVQRFDVTVAAHGPGPLREWTEAAGAHYVPLRHVQRPVNPLRDALGLIELMGLCRRLRPHVVHANSSKAGVLGRIAATLTGVPARVFTVHGWAFSAYAGAMSHVYRWADRLLAPVTNLVICVAENELNAGLRAGTCITERTVVIPNAVSLDGPVAARGGSVPTLISVGRFQWPKDFETLVAALTRLQDREFRALLVGDGPELANIEALVERNGLGDRVSLLGRRSDVPTLLAEGDVFVLSSWSEGMPISVLEAMAAGLPVVATEVGGVAELVAAPDTGFLVPAGDAAGLAARIDRLLRDPELRARMGMAARARIEESFSLEAFRAAHLEAYDRVTDGIRPAHSEAVGMPTA